MASREHLVMRKNMSYGLWSSVWSPAKHMLTLEWGGSERLEAEGKTGLHCETELLGRMGTESFLGLQSGHQPSHREVAQPQSLWTAPPIRSSHFVFFDCQDSAFVPWPRSTHLCVVRSGIASACQQVPWQTPKTQTGRSLDTHSRGSYFPVHQPLFCCGSPGPRKLHRSSHQGCLMGSIFRKPPSG